uniref:Uncharacterized protein n=1 Tax=Caenorhabditis japonica TaxID=281687 RepID=A0A8R1I1R7_CAEJA
MMKFVKKKTATSPQQQVIEISKPTNLIVSKHRLVRTDGDMILIIEGNKVIGLVDKKDLEGSLSQIVPVQSISPPASLNSPLESSSRSDTIDELPPLPSPVGTTPLSYQRRPTGLFATQHSSPPMLSGSRLLDNLNFTSSEDHDGYIQKSTSVEQLFSTPMTPRNRNRSETALQPQGSHKYDTIAYIPGSSQCNGQSRLDDERCPPPPTRAPPAPLAMSPVLCTIVEPNEKCLDYTEVQTVSVQVPQVENTAMEDLRMNYAEDLDSFIEEQAMKKWNEEREKTERWIRQIAGEVAKDEARNTIRGVLLQNGPKKTRSSVKDVFQHNSDASSSLNSSVVQDPLDPEPKNEYEWLYVSKTKTPPLSHSHMSRQSTQESDGDTTDTRF